VSEETREVPQEKKKPIRRRYAVDRLPSHVQAAIFRGYGRGEAYWKICQEVERLGHKLSENALSRYWRNVWSDEVGRIRMARHYKEALKEALQLAPTSENAELAEELLYSMVMLMLEKMKQEKPLDMMKEAREQGKAAPKDSGKRQPPKTGAEEGQAVRERWRALYGLEGTNESDEAKAEEC